jgi:hypothetical protein
MQTPLDSTHGQDETTRRTVLTALAAVASGFTIGQYIKSRNHTGGWLGGGGGVLPGGEGRTTEPPFTVAPGSVAAIHAAQSYEDIGVPREFPAILLTMDSGWFILPSEPPSGHGLDEATDETLVKHIDIKRAAADLATPDAFPAIGLTLDAGKFLALDADGFTSDSQTMMTPDSTTTATTLDAVPEPDTFPAVTWTSNSGLLIHTGGDN